MSAEVQENHMNESQVRSILHTLKRHADTLDASQGVLLRHLLDDLQAAVFGGDVDGLNQAEQALVERGQPILAMKALRGRFIGTTDPRATLVGAKNVVEAYMVRHPVKTA